MELSNTPQKCLVLGAFKAVLPHFTGFWPKLGLIMSSRIGGGQIYGGCHGIFPSPAKTRFRD